MGSKLIAHLLLAVYTSAAPPKAFFVFFSSMLKDPEWPEAYEAVRALSLTLRLTLTLSLILPCTVSRRRLHHGPIRRDGVGGDGGASLPYS